MNRYGANNSNSDHHRHNSPNIFDSPPRPMGRVFEPSHPPQQLHTHTVIGTGQKRAFPFSGRAGGSPNRGGRNFAKLFVGSVPRAVTEDDIRPLFEEHGNVIEVALIKDKKTGQPQGCCFIKYSTLEEADRAIRALHNQHTLPGGLGPIQVRYADGERERLGAVEYKLFVGSLNKQATEMDVQEIFSRFGRVEDVYLMRDELKQSRGCGFVKYSDREMALAAIDALNGIYRMRGCDQPLTVRFADPKRPRTGAADSRGGAPAFGGPGFGPRFQVPGTRPVANFGDVMGDKAPWHPEKPQDMGPAFNSNIRSMESQLLPRSSDLAIPLNSGGSIRGPSDGSLSGPAVSSSSQQVLNQPPSQVPTLGLRISPLHKPLQSPQGLPTSFQLHPLATVPYSQAQTSHVGQPQFPLSATHTPYTQVLNMQQYIGLSGQSAASRPQENTSSAAVVQNPSTVSLPSNIQSNFVPSMANQEQLPLPMQQQLLQPPQHSPSQLAQMLSQQTQTLQASFQSSQQAFSQLQQQLQLMQPSSENITLQPNLQGSKQQIVSNTAATTSTAVSSSVPTATVPVVTPAECHWTEHTSPDGFKYYHNSVTRESRWEKPEELTLFEQRQQQKPPVQLPQTRSLPAQQASQVQQSLLQAELQMQMRNPPQLQQAFYPPLYPATGARNQPNLREPANGQLPVVPSHNDPAHFQQGLQNLAWKNKP